MGKALLFGFLGLMVGIAAISIVTYDSTHDGNVTYNQEKLTVVYGTLHFTADVKAPPKSEGILDVPVKVVVKVDEQEFLQGKDDGKGHYLLDVDTTKLQDGKHLLSVVATWGNQVIGEEDKVVLVDNQDAKKEGRIKG